MNSENYTLKEMADVLSSAFPDENPEKCARKIRHWTSMDLLATQGKKHTGTGVSREYAPEELYKAAILMELSRWKVPMPVLADNFETMLSEYEDFEDWQNATHGICNVFLMLSWNEDFVNWGLSSGEVNLGALSLPDDPQSEKYLRVKLKENLFIDTVNSAVVLNITRLFLRIREHVDW